MAVQCGQQEAVLKLLQLGADKNIESNFGKSPADLAASLKMTQVTRGSTVFYSGGGASHCKSHTTLIPLLQISRILSSNTHLATLQASGSVEEKFFTEQPSSVER